MKLLDSINAYVTYDPKEKKSIPTSDEQIRKLEIEKNILVAIMAVYSHHHDTISILRKLLCHYEEAIDAKKSLDNFKTKAMGQTEKALKEKFIIAINTLNDTIERIRTDFKPIFATKDMQKDADFKYLNDADRLYRSYYDENKKSFFEKESKSLLKDLKEIKSVIEARLSSQKTPSSDRADFIDAAGKLETAIERLQKGASKDEIYLIKNVIRDAIGLKVLIKKPSNEDDAVDVLRIKISNLEVLLNEVEALPSKNQSFDNYVDQLKINKEYLAATILKLKEHEFDFMTLTRPSNKLTPEDGRFIQELDNRSAKIFEWVVKVYPSLAFSPAFQELVTHSIYKPEESKMLNKLGSLVLRHSPSNKNTLENSGLPTTPLHRRTTQGLIGLERESPKAKTPKNTEKKEFELENVSEENEKGRESEDEQEYLIDDEPLLVKEEEIGADKSPFLIGNPTSLTPEREQKNNSTLPADNEPKKSRHARNKPVFYGGGGTLFDKFEQTDTETSKLTVGKNKDKP